MQAKPQVVKAASKTAAASVVASQNPVHTQQTAAVSSGLPLPSTSRAFDSGDSSANRTLDLPGVTPAPAPQNDGAAVVAWYGVSYMVVRRILDENLGRKNTGIYPVLKQYL